MWARLILLCLLVHFLSRNLLSVGIIFRRLWHTVPKRSLKKYQSLPGFYQIQPKSRILFLSLLDTVENRDFAVKNGYDYFCGDLADIFHNLPSYEHVIFSKRAKNRYPYELFLQKAGDIELILFRDEKNKSQVCRDIMIFRSGPWSLYKVKQLYWEGFHTLFDQIYTTYTTTLAEVEKLLDAGFPLFLSHMCVYHGLSLENDTVYPHAPVTGFTQIITRPFQTIFSDQRIPPYIFQTMETTLIPNKMAKAMQKWSEMNPGYGYYYFDALERRNFIRKNFPEPVYQAYDKVLPGAYQADLWRYCVLYHYGGVYADSRTRPLVPLSELIHPHDRFVVPRDEFRAHVWQGFMASTPRHPILRLAIAQTCANILQGNYTSSPLDVSGPGLLGRQINEYMGRDTLAPIHPGYFPVFCIRFLDYSLASQPFVRNNGKNVIHTRSVSDSKFIQITGKEKYDPCWFNRRIYKVPLP